jgi:hypothetical protein
VRCIDEPRVVFTEFPARDAPCGVPQIPLDEAFSARMPSGFTAFTGSNPGHRRFTSFM